MPKRTDIKSILLLGAGPIVIGQACEFDYSGTQARKALREEGYRVILVNSNPATIMTDPDMADAIYIEPIDWQTVEKIIEIGHRIMGFKKPKLVLPDDFYMEALTPSQKLILRGTILAINFQTKLNSSYTKQILKRYHFNMPEMTDKLLAKNIEYFKDNIRIGGIYHDRKI